MNQVTQTITAEQIVFFKEEGYLKLDALTTQEEIAKIRVIYDHLFATQAGREEGNEFDLAGTDDGQKASLPQILDPAKYAPELNETQLLINATTIGKQLLGDHATIRFAHAIFKPAMGPETPWHQDGAYGSSEAISHDLSFWIPLQDTTTDMGCLNFVPKSQQLDILNHQPINNDPRIHGLELTADEFRHVKEPVSCPLAAGGSTIHGRHMLHQADANTTSLPRRALIIFACIPATPRKTSREFPWLNNRETAREKRASSYLSNKKS